MPKIFECFTKPTMLDVDRITTRATKDIVGCRISGTTTSAAISQLVGSVHTYGPNFVGIELDGFKSNKVLLVTLQTASKYCTLNGVRLYAVNNKGLSYIDALMRLSVILNTTITAFNIIDDSAAVILFSNGAELLIKADVEDGTIEDALLIAPNYSIWAY